MLGQRKVKKKPGKPQDLFGSGVEASAVTEIQTNQVGNPADPRSGGPSRTPDHLEMNERTEITFETEETVILREGARVSFTFCTACSREVLMATPQAAAFLSGVTERHIFRLLEAGSLHFTEDGPVRVCLESVGLIRNEVEA